MTWHTVRLEAVAPRVSETVDPRSFGEELVEHYSIPALEETGQPEVVRAADIMSTKQLLRGREVMVSRLNPRKARVIAVPALRGIAVASGEFVILAPSRIEGRFLTYLLLSERVRQYLDSRVQSVTRSHQRIRPEVLLKMGIRIPAPASQRAIADYLDTETSRIDTLITKKRRMVQLFQQRWRAEIMNTIYGDRSIRQGAIRHVVDLQPGYAFPSSRFVEDGIRLLRGANIAPGRLRWETDVVCVPPEARIALSDYELAEGDLVLGMDRPFIGTGIRVATVTESDLPCLLVQRVARIRSTERSDARYIRLLMESDAFVAHLTPVFTGVSVPHVSAEQILSFRAPLPSRNAQRRVATRLERKRIDLSDTADLLATQITLLTERRQALITAAVTGDLSVA